MGIVDDILSALDRIPIWKRLGEVPGEVDDLKRRVAELEKMLAGKWPADVCKSCGARAVRMSFSNVDATKKIRQEWSCEECQMVEIRYG